MYEHFGMRRPTQNLKRTWTGAYREHRRHLRFWIAVFTLIFSLGVSALIMHLWIGR